MTKITNLKKINEDVKLTPYDKANAKRLAAIDRIAGVDRGTDEYHAAMGKRATANREFKQEQERGLDDTWRKRRAVDECRASDEGRPTYNATRL